MKVTLGKDGLGKTYQNAFPEMVKCCKCKGESKIAFVAHEGLNEDDLGGPSVCGLHPNKGKKGGFWLHDLCAVAVYFCRECLKPTALSNQA